MFLNTSLLLHHLSKERNILSFNTGNETSLYSFRIYDGVHLEDHFLYLIRLDQLAFLEHPRAEAAFLCAGVPEAPDLKMNQDFIMIQEPLDLTELINTVAGIFDLYKRWENDLLGCPANLEGIQKMLDISQPVLQGSIILADYHFNYVAYTRDFEKSIRQIRREYHGQTPSYIVDELLTDPEYFKVQNSRELFEYPIHNGSGTVPALCYNLFRENEEEYRARFLFVPQEQPPAPWHGFLLKFLAAKVNTIYNQLSDFSMPLQVYEGLREAMRNSILGKTASLPLLSQVLKYVRWNLEDRYQLLKFVPGFCDNTKEINAVSRNQLELMYQNSCAILYENCIVLLINLTQNREYESRPIHTHANLSLFLRNNLYKVGISQVFHSFTEIPGAYQEAQAALQLGNTRDTMFWYYNFSDYALDYILNRCSEKINREHLCHRGLLRLMEYDREHHTDYLQKLQVYIEEKFNVSHAADRLFIHRTTLLKHLKKITELTGIDFHDRQTLLHVLLSLELLGQ